MSKTKIIITGIVIILIFAGYIVFVKKDATSTDKLVSSVAPEKKAEKQIGAEILSALSTLEKLNLDTTFFQDSLFRGLKNFSKPIQDQPVKRDNPFAPVGSISASSTVN